MINLVSKNWFKILLVLLICFFAVFYFLSNRYYFIQKEALIIKCDKFTGNCKYESLLEKKEYSHCNYEVNNLAKDNNYYIGIIKNTSIERHYLKAMIAKIYNNDDVLIGEGYESMSDWIEPGKSLSFRIHTFIDNDTDLKRDIYPWFETCK